MLKYYGIGLRLRPKLLALLTLLKSFLLMTPINTFNDLSL